MDHAHAGAARREPGKDGGPRRHYVMLYDSVPGGTGYLRNCWHKDAGTLSDVLKMALDAVTGCACSQDPEKDGCTTAAYQYRLGRSMELVSRDAAKSVLGSASWSLGPAWACGHHFGHLHQPEF